MKAEHLHFIITENEMHNNMIEKDPSLVGEGRCQCYVLCLSERRWRVVPSDAAGFGASAEECGWGGVKTEACCEREFNS